jgi:hypothetical protein
VLITEPEAEVLPGGSYHGSLLQIGLKIVGTVCARVKSSDRLHKMVHQFLIRFRGLIRIPCCLMNCNMINLENGAPEINLQVQTLPTILCNNVHEERPRVTLFAGQSVLSPTDAFFIGAALEVAADECCFCCCCRNICCMSPQEGRSQSSKFSNNDGIFLFGILSWFVLTQKKHLPLLFISRISFPRRFSCCNKDSRGYSKELGPFTLLLLISILRLNLQLCQKINEAISSNK